MDELAEQEDTDSDATTCDPDWYGCARECSKL